MKKITLLLLILLSFACHGQVYTIKNGDTINTGYGMKSLRATTTGNSSTPLGHSEPFPNTSGTPDTYFGMALIQPMSQLSLEEKLLQYAEECYNDSMRYCYYTLCDMECWDVPCECGKNIPPFDMPCNEKYIHRKPTFEGFIEWLRKK